MSEILTTKLLRYKYFLLCLAGVLSALALAPIGFVAILWLTLPILYWSVLNSNSKKSAFFTGWIFALSYGVASLYWISFALFVELDKWWWLVPFALLLLPSVIAIYTGIATVVMFLVKKYLVDIWGLFLFATIFTLASYAQGYLFTGFPWNLIGYSWVDASIAVAQNFVWAGIYGMTFITAICAVAPVVFFLKISNVKKFLVVFLSIFTIFLMWEWGSNRLNIAGGPKFYDSIIIKVVQPNIKQEYKWKAEKQIENLNKYLDMSVSFSNDELQPTHIIWPETALTIDIGRFPEAEEYIREKLPSNVILMTGNIREDSKGFFNSLLVMDIGTGEKKYFDKTHLVPFGEYVPFRKIISIGAIGSAISILEDFQKGDGPYLAEFKNTPAFSPLICYEIIFPDEIINKRKNKPKWILNITNDGWYGNSSGPYQHLAITRARAIENSIPVIRAAGTGISAVIDSMGRIIEKIPLNDSGSITLKLPHVF